MSKLLTPKKRKLHELNETNTHTHTQTLTRAHTEWRETLRKAARCRSDAVHKTQPVAQMSSLGRGH